MHFLPDTDHSIEYKGWMVNCVEGNCWFSPLYGTHEYTYCYVLVVVHMVNTLI